MINDLYYDYYNIINNIINLLNILYKLGFKERYREGESSKTLTLKNTPQCNAHKLYMLIKFNTIMDGNVLIINIVIVL